MTLDEVHELVDRVAAVGAGCRDRDTLTATVAALGRLRSWVEHRDVVVAHALEEVAGFAEQTLARAGRQRARDAARTVERAEVAQAAPVFASALAAGDVGGAHLDAFGRGWRRLEPDRRAELLADAERLVAVATTATPEEFERTVTATVRRLEAGDGLERLERQRRAARLRTWVDPATGMWCFRGQLDPETGVRVDQRLQHMVDTLFAERAPEGCPADPGERQDHLRAQALVALTEGRGASGFAELTGVVDSTAVDSDGVPAFDWGLPVEIPPAVLADLAGTADTAVIVVRNGVVLHAPGKLMLGRSTRIANRAQRRVLRALYRTCAMPECRVRFDACKIHHVIWWEHGGLTDVVNLLPVCERHHHAIHDLGWLLTLSADRTLTVIQPDGTRQTTGPPSRRHAA